MSRNFKGFKNGRMKKFILKENEEKILVGILYNHITFGTTLEVFGELTLEGIQRLDLLRNILRKFLKKFSLSDKLPEETYLILGMPDFIKKASLEKWEKNEQNKHLQIRAKYFLGKHHGK